MVTTTAMSTSRRFLASALLCLLAATTTMATPSASIGSLLSRELSQQATRQITSTLKEHLEQEKLNKNNANTEDKEEEQQLRKLEAEDFNEFRELFSRATILLPDFESSEPILFADLVVKAKNVKCMDIVIGELALSYVLASKQQLLFKVDMNDIDLMCTLDYEWVYSFFNGSGVAKITLNDNNINTMLSFTSVDFDLYPPTSSQTESCNTDITISDMEFSGSVTDQVLNVFESLMRTYIEEEVQTTACEELGTLGSTFVQDMIDMVGDYLNPYLEPLPAEETNATVAESLMEVPPEVRLMDFQAEGEEQSWFWGALKQVDGALGVWLIDPNTPREGGKDLGINIALRENILNEKREFVIEMADLPFNFDPVIYEGQDQLTDTSIRLDTVRILGLDTFNAFSPFEPVGHHTLQNTFGWDFLSFEVDVTMDIKPSSSPESMLAQTSDRSLHIIEKVTMRIGVDNVNATLSFLAAVDEDAFGALRLGPLMHEDNIVPCFMSSLFRAEVTVLEAKVDNIREPSIEGFIDKGIDNIITNAVNAAFLMYESVFIKAMPNIFQTTLKDTVNNNFFLNYEDPCPEPIQTEGYIDFRDLLTSPETAASLGGSGTAPYGTIAGALFEFLKTQIATVDADGTLSANDMFIRPFTSEQSGENGTLHLPGDLFSITGEDLPLGEGLEGLFQGFKFGVKDVRAHNLDVMVPPFEFLDPTTDPNAVNNEVHFGPVEGRPLNVSALLTLAFSEASPFAVADMDNEIKITMTSSAFEIFVEIVARVQAMALFNFPIDDLLNLQCWLATIPAPALNELGIRVDPEDERGIHLKEFVNRFVDLNVDVECLNCTSKGLSMMPEVLELLRTTDVTAVLASRMKFLVQDIAVSDSLQTVLDRTLDSASKSCPHSPAYTSDVESIGFGFAELPLPELSQETIDTVQFVLAATLQVGFVLFTQMFSQTEIDPADSLERQNLFEIPEGSNLVNFSGFELNLPSPLDSVYDDLINMVTGTRVDPVTGQEDLSVNIFARDFLETDGVFEMELDGYAFGPEEISIELYSIRLEGLDTFKRFDVGVPAAPQTIYNDIEMGMLAFSLDFGLRSGGAFQRIKVGFRFDDISLSVPLFAAIDMDFIKAIQVGSLLSISSIIPCFFSSVYGFNIPNMVVNVGQIHKPTVEGLMNETDASLTNLVDAMFEQYGTAMHESLPSMFDNAVRPILNSLFDYFISGNGQGCPNPLLDLAQSARKLMLAAGPPFVDFRDMFLSEAKSLVLGGRGDSRYGDLIRSVWGLIEEEVFFVDGETGVSPINSDIIGPLTASYSNSSGDLFFPGDLLNTEFELDLGAFPTGVSFRVSDIRISNLDSIGNPFSLLDPVADRPSILNNTATIGVGNPLRFSLNLNVDIASIGKRAALVELWISIYSLFNVYLTRFYYNEKKAHHQRKSQMTSISPLTCVQQRQF